MQKIVTPLGAEISVEGVEYPHQDAAVELKIEVNYGAETKDAWVIMSYENAVELHDRLAEVVNEYRLKKG